MQNNNNNRQNRSRDNGQNVKRRSPDTEQRTARRPEDASERVRETGERTRRSAQGASASGQARPRRAAAQGEQDAPELQEDLIQDPRSGSKTVRRSGSTSGSRKGQGASASGQARPAKRAGSAKNAKSAQSGGGGKKPPKRAGKAGGKKQKRPDTPHEAAKRKRRKIVLFVAEIFLLLILVAALWAVKQVRKMPHVKINDEDIVINEDVKEQIESGTSKLQGYRNIALFGVDSREGQLDKNTRTDTIMIASINLDTKEVKLISVYRDTWLNMSNDDYSKANAAYARGGPTQAISMLNMNLDMDITDYVTIGFKGLIDVIDAVGGIEIDVQEAEISYLNDYQKCMTGEPTGTLNSAGEPDYDATPGVDYTPVTHAGLQTLNGTQATAYARIRYVGNDFMRTQRQRTVLTQVAKKAVTLNPSTLDKIANAVFPNISTSLELSEILSLLSDIASYEIGESAGFPFDGYVEGNGRIGGASVVVPIDLTKNVSLLHEFLFDETGYDPSDTVKKCSQKIVEASGLSYSGE